MQVATQTLEAQAAPVNEPTGSEDEAAAAFAAHDQAEEVTNQDEAEPDDEPTADADEEPSDGEPEADDEPKEELVEVEFEGKTYEVAPELQKGLMRQADYSRKMNEVGATQKAYAQQLEHAEKLVEGAEKFADALAEVKSIDAEMKRFEKVDWQALRAQNPAEYAALAADLQSLRLSKEDAVRKSQSLDGEITKARQESIAAKQAEMYATLAKEIKGWGDEKGREITQYALQHGYTVDELRSLTDPKVVIALEKARRFDALQAAKTTLKAKAQDAPKVTKPGTTRKPDVRNDAMKRLRQDNTTESAEAAFLSRM